MSDIYQPEQHALEQANAAQAAEQQAVDARVDQAEPAKLEAAVDNQQTTDAGELQDQVVGRQYDAAVEADRKVEQAKDADSIHKPIDVKDFEKSGLMTNQEVQTYLDNTLPAEHVNGERVQEIRYTDRFVPERDGNVLGVCSTDQETGVSEIQVNRQEPEGSFDKGEMEHTLTHEVGHNAYWNLAPEARNQWDNLSSSSKAYNYVSDYAMTNTGEDFAESYSYYVRDPVLLRDVSMPKYSFMQSAVFNGRQYG